MAVDLICPDCGGVIGSNGADGRPPCKCFARAPASRTDRTDESDTVSIPAQVIDQSSQAEKVCVVCGRNVSGHRRVKDSRGYLCYECARAEISQEQAGKIPCAECGRRVKEAGLIDYGGIRICRKCYADHKESKKKMVKKVATHHYEAHEKQRLMILTAIFVILGLIVLWRTFLS